MLRSNIKLTVRLAGLNKRAVYVDPTLVTHLEDLENDGRIATNIHLQTGKWITVSGSADENFALLSEEVQNESDDLAKSEINKWRRRAKDRVLYQKAIEEALEEVERKGYKLPEATSSEIVTLPDGSTIIKLMYDPEASKEWKESINNISNKIDAISELADK